MQRQERSRRSCRPGVLEYLESRQLLTMTAVAPLPQMRIELGASVAPVELDSYFKDDKATTDYALFDTTAGAMPVLLTPQTTPATVTNFLNNVDAGKYTNTLVDRSVAGSSLRAGGYQLATDSSIKPVATGAPLAAEAGGAAVRGTIAMTGSGAGSSSSSFVLNETDNSAAGEGTVFGRVVGPQGLAVMDALAAVPVPTTSPLAAPLNQAPLRYYTAGQPLQTYNLTMVNSVTKASEVYEAATDAPDVATATIDGNELKVTALSAGTAHIAVVGYGSDGTPAAESFTVNVLGGLAATAQTPPPALPSLPATATLPTPASYPTSLLPDATGRTPATAVAGAKVKIQQTVTLSNSTTNVDQVERVSLSLSADGTTPQYGIATASSRVKVKIGGQAKVNLTANRIGAAVPAGAYHLLVSVTDPDGAETTIDTGKTMLVRAAHS